MALSDSNPWARRDAARELYVPDWDIREVVPALRRLLADQDDQVRLDAAITVSGVGDQTAKATLVEFANSAKYVNWRTSADAALARLRTLEGEAAMCRYLKDQEHAAWAAGWLAEMGTTSSILLLLRARRWASEVVP